MAASAPAVVAAQTTIPSVVESLASNTKFIGGLWMASSALLTTYSTTSFLKYKHATPAITPIDNNEKSVEPPKPTTTSPLVGVLRDLPRPALLTLFRFGGSLLLGLVLHPDLMIMHRIRDTMAALPDFVLPAVFLFVANFSNSLALNRIGISLTYTSKCAIPVFTVVLTYLLDGAKALPNLPTLLSLIPIATGIALASWDSPVFEPEGFAYAMISCSAQTALNVCSKKSLARTGISGPEGQRAMVSVGLILSMLSIVLMQKPNNNNNNNPNSPSSSNVATTTATDPSEQQQQLLPPTWLAMMAVTAYHMEYVLSFIFVKMVAPVAYGACDAVRRLTIIISGHYMFGHDRFTRLNILGIATALLGALAYAISSHAF